MSNLPAPLLFNFEENEVPIYMDPDNNPWILLSAVCKIIGIIRNVDVISRLDNDEYCEIEMMGANNNVIKKYLVNESGFYSAVLRSNKPEAKRFKRWITHDVIPSIRKTGSYSIVKETHPTINTPSINTPTTFLEALELCVDLEKKRLVLEEENKIMQPKAEFYDAVIDDSVSWSINEVSKLIGIPNFGMHKLFEHLRSQSVLMWDNSPYQKYMNMHYFKVVEVITAVGVKKQTRVTQRGVDFIIRNLTKCNIIKGVAHAAISGGKLGIVNVGKPTNIAISSSASM